MHGITFGFLSLAYSNKQIKTYILTILARTVWLHRICTYPSRWEQWHGEIDKFLPTRWRLRGAVCL